MKYSEIIADNLKKAGWRCGCISSTDHDRRQFWVVAAEREDAGRFIVRADEKLTAAFLELESVIRGFRRLCLTGRCIFQNWPAMNPSKVAFNGISPGFSTVTEICTGNYNTATGIGALQNNTAGRDNTATGASALDGNTTGRYDTATGNFALHGNTTGFNNTAIGARALLRNTTGSFNIALGVGAGNSLTGGDRNIDIGNDGEPGESATIRIGTVNEQTRTFIAGIVETTLGGGDTVFVNNAGMLGVHTSSARFKDEIKPMDKASEVILGLKPVTSHYKKELDPNCIPQFGLVAEDVEKVSPDLVARDRDGKPYTVRYEAVNAMLLNEFLKEHRRGEEQDRKIQEQATMITELRSEMKALTTTVNEQASQLQKVSAQLQINNAGPKMAAE